MGNKKIMEKPVNIHTVCQCNKMLGEKTLHPLVSVIDLSGIRLEQSLSFKAEFYSVLLQEYTCEYFAYGRKACDYSDGSVVFLRPGEVVDIERHSELLPFKRWLLIFHPELILNTSLGLNIRSYTFFAYGKEEALHLSGREKRLFMKCLEHIGEELVHQVDRHSRTLMAKSVELLLDYCIRFYDRQFITRSEENKAIIRKIDRIINEYYQKDDCKEEKNVISAKYCAQLMELSPAYLTDLLKQERGQTIQEYMEGKHIGIAKKWLLERDKSIEEIAGRLGYSSVEYFTRLFSRMTGESPGEYRLKN